MVQEILQENLVMERSTSLWLGLKVIVRSSKRAWDQTAQWIHQTGQEAELENSETYYWPWFQTGPVRP